MENTTEESQNNLENPEMVVRERKSQHVIAGVALLLVVFIILFVLFNPADEVSAPVLDANQAEETATTTATTTNEVATTSLGASATMNQEEQVFVGDGYSAVIRPVKKETPVINEFTTRVTASGESCMYSWNVSKAQRCNLITGAGTGISRIGTEGSLQIKPGTYTLACEGTGGGKVVSEPLTCEV